MKVLIVSDIHGNYLNMKKVLDDNPDFDYFFLLGDILSGPSIEGYDPDKLAELLNTYSNKIFYVRGNCDHYRMDLLDFYMEKDAMIIPVDGRNVYFTHGHIYDECHLPDYEIPFEVYIQGHTHVPVMREEHGVLFLNPGSITNPRGMSDKSYIFYQDGTYYLKEVDTNQVIKKCYFR